MALQGFILPSMPQHVWNPCQSVELHKTRTFEGNSTDWATSPRQVLKSEKNAFSSHNSNQPTIRRNPGLAGALAEGDLVAGPVLDRDLVAGLGVQVDGGRWSRDVERDPEVRGRDGQLQGSDLVGRVTVGGDPVSPDDHGRDFLKQYLSEDLGAAQREHLSSSLSSPGLMLGIPKNYIILDVAEIYRWHS